MILRYSFLFFGIFIFNGCLSKKSFILLNGEKYANVLNYGAKGDGNHNDVYEIQDALFHERNLYFPKGRYLIFLLTEVKIPF